MALTDFIASSTPRSASPQVKEANAMAVVYSTSYWRKIAAPIIAKVIARVGTDDPKALRRALLEAYPFWERRYHPYRIWRDEIRRQLNPSGKACIARRGAISPPNPGQCTLF
jgi:hypothetical protein